MILDFLLSIVREFALVLIAGLVLGAGLPTLYSVGIRLLAWGAGAQQGDTREHPGSKHLIGRVLAYLIFTLVGLVVLLGISVIVLSGFGIRIGI